MEAKRVLRFVPSGEFLKSRVDEVYGDATRPFTKENLSVILCNAMDQVCGQTVFKKNKNVFNFHIVAVNCTFVLLTLLWISKSQLKTKQKKRFRNVSFVNFFMPFSTSKQQIL